MSTQSPLALSIFNAEGGENSAGFSQNNPGDIFGSDGTLNTYSTLQEGWNALEAQISKYLTGSSAYANGDTSISDLAQTYTGGDNASGWASSVASGVGLSPSASISQAASSQPSQSLLQKFGQYLSGSGVAGPVGMLAGSAAQGASLTGAVGQFFTDLFSTRFVFGLVGVILIAGGILGFDKVQEVAATAVKTTAEASA